MPNHETMNYALCAGEPTVTDHAALWANLDRADDLRGIMHIDTVSQTG